MEGDQGAAISTKGGGGQICFLDPLIKRWKSSRRGKKEKNERIKEESYKSARWKIVKTPGSRV